MIRTKLSIFASIRRGCLAMWRDQDGIAAIVMAIFLPVLVAVERGKSSSKSKPTLKTLLRSRQC